MRLFILIRSVDLRVRFDVTFSEVFFDNSRCVRWAHVRRP